MSNLSYCRYENTLRDLQDCQNALRSDEYDVEELSASEFNAMTRLIELCGEIYHEFEVYPTCVPDEDYDSSDMRAWNPE